MSAWNEPELLNSTLKCNFCDQLKFDMTTLFLLFFLNCVQNHKMPAAFQLRVILITVVLFIIGSCSTVCGVWVALELSCLERC